MALPPHKRQILRELGVDVWVPRAPQAPLPHAETPGDAGRGADHASEVVAASHDLALLQTQVAACQRCGLQQSRTQTVFGIGNPDADWLFIGEAPGFHEDQQGEPFVGAAGQLLTKMIAALKMAREEVYIANVLKCRPPNNRDPSLEEVTHCEPYLHQQIELIQPKVIVALGRIAGQALLKSDQSLGRLRARVHQYGPLQTPLVVTYHPAYLLRTPQDKRKTWEDLQLAQRTTAGG